MTLIAALLDRLAMTDVARQRAELCAEQHTLYEWVAVTMACSP
jgi:hypothetical protein